MITRTSALVCASLVAILCLSGCNIPDIPAPARPSVEQMIRTRWAGTGHEERAVRIARCESGLNPRAKNRSSSASGVFQLMRPHWAGKFNPFDPQANIEYAYKLWKGSGWRPWVCRG